MSQMEPRFEAIPYDVEIGIHVVIDTWERGLIISEHRTAAEARREADRANAGFSPAPSLVEENQTNE